MEEANHLLRNRNSQVSTHSNLFFKEINISCGRLSLLIPEAFLENIDDLEQVRNDSRSFFFFKYS